MTLLSRVRDWWTEFLTGRSASPRAVIINKLGVSLASCPGSTETQHSIRWNEVGAVFAYKQDCATVDQICITFVDLGGEVRLAVSEDDAGYQQLVEDLPRHLPGCLAPADWFQLVAFPAFETNWTELYRIPFVSSPDGAVVSSLGRMADSVVLAELQLLTSHLRNAIPIGLKGSLRFWGEWFGRPHDKVYTLVSCEIEQTALRLLFDQGETLSIWSPKGLTIDRSTFRIADARRVRWEWFAQGQATNRQTLYFMEFIRSGEIITASTNVDWYEPKFHLNAAESAFELVNRLD
ncbi:hypothetical protein [Paludibaculum fermentans]|uniref:Uncharacterized protein n=1 Tax=Paludibaculum fermentans TaxID=1473598 RepID=A0A7S7SJF2_PALFE|nr:hypothetical protein [Paludibaculum fermentans]QOY86618.1 hypothetical protein IRI77_28070 [Paludibaculum fermentans]